MNMIKLSDKTQTFYQARGKRWLDLAFALPMLILLSPLLASLAIVIRWKLGSPVLFRQKRPGKLGRIFTIYKFRSMTDETDSNGNPLPDDRRLGRFGQFLRASSLDELPELWNIVQGTMSFVGPRPLMTEYLSRYSPTQARRHEVPAGITGWAQINGRNTISWEQKFEFDVWYVEHQCFSLDLKILFLTFYKVLKRDDISADGHATMPKFMGTELPVDVKKAA
jgi:sugar transferase EpsL